jgi:NAD+ synthase (glutamine-hydrolysing)
MIKQKDKEMKIVLAQMNSTTGNLAGNSEKIIQEIAKAEKNGADLIVFPEMAVTGYCISDMVEDNEFVKQNKLEIEKIAKLTRKTAAIVGFVDYDEREKNGDGRMVKYNAAAVLQEGKVIEIVHKTLLPNYRYFDDKRYFSPGKQRKPVRINIKESQLEVGISICEDMWDDNYEIKVIPELVKAGAELIININASPFTPGKFFTRLELARRHIKQSQVPLVYTNSVGTGDIGKNIIPFDGQSFVSDSYGNLVAKANSFAEESLEVKLSLTGKNKTIKVEEQEREKEIYEAIVMSLRDYAKKTGFTRAIEPVSGGIDSALGLVLCAEAFGKGNVIAYNLPSRFNTSTTKGIAERLAKNLGVEYKIIPIQEIDNLVRDTFQKNAHKIENKVAKENLHARIRGMLMMLESNDSGALLASNGNKTEIALGYSTLYGDMCGGFSLIGDLSKIDVYKVSRYANKRYGKEIIPEEAFTIKPSAELSEGQFDPFDYYVTSPLVDMLVEKIMSPREIIKAFNEKKLDPEYFIKDPQSKTVYDKHTPESFSKLVFDTYALMRRSVYKRVQSPPIIVVTERAFGFDRRETMINQWGG